MNNIGKLSALTATAILLSAIPAHAEEDASSNTVNVTIKTINVIDSPLEIQLVSPAPEGGTDVECELPVAATEILGDCKWAWDMNVRTSSGSERAKIVSRTTGLDDPSVLGDIVVESKLMVKPAFGTDEFDTLMNSLFDRENATYGRETDDNPRFQPCAFALTVGKNAAFLSGPLERLGCQRLMPGWNSIDGDNPDPTPITANIEVKWDATVNSADRVGPLSAGEIRLGFTWIIETYDGGDPGETDVQRSIPAEPAD